MRPRRLRSSSAVRELVAENHVRSSDLIYPIFVREGLSSPREIESMPGVFQHSEASLLVEIDEVLALGIRSVMLFAIPEHRDEVGSEALNENGILARSVRAVKERVGDRLVVIADLCLDEFTSHGHCGVLCSSGDVDNDLTLMKYSEMARVLGKAGADMLGLSGMMDNQVAAVRESLDQAGLQDVAILAYAAKYASAFYGPFRDAVESQLTGDRRGYQQDPRNRKEAAREVLLDIEQGADIVMVKPALSYLDIVSDIASLSNVPVAAYVVSGEYAMVELAASVGLIDRDRSIFEILHSVKRSGASLICTYWAKDYARRDHIGNL
ncbi:porphobilinogen synthase [Aquiluna borgnonia]|uniref:Delta-aminolevulinic acid dehydratase n=1 Tax=Aquiluna borgnonia TaxID=2499157 RepID=A0A7D4TUS7_9MICO|nr:porphobilinogen synthase [Aquiluna borgnonia]QKJ25715.1 porphobilinogen synthase [Aquiluna borgnonia]